MSFYTGLVKGLSGFFKWIYKLDIIGKENIPENGSYIVVSNHISLGDVFILAISCKRQIFFMAKKELFKIPVLAQVIKGLGAFPVDRSGSGISALKTAVKYLGDEKLVGMFPQGTRHPGKSVSDTEFKTGVAFVSYRSKASIIPAYIKTDRQKFNLFKKTEIIFGKPISYESLGFVDGGKDEYEKATYIIKDVMFSLEKQAYGGKYNG